MILKYTITVGIVSVMVGIASVSDISNTLMFSIDLRHKLIDAFFG